MSLNTGETLNNRYRIVKLLGQGGFGAVYKAWDVNLNRQCALKENFETSEDAQRQFFREASVLANLSHTNLPRVTDYFAIPDQGQYLVMDFIDGQDLNSYVEANGAVPPQQALKWISQVMDALIYLHGRKPPVIHRDIKPANIRITPEGQAVLVDFGLVKLYQANLQTTVGARAITPGYSPPEQYGQGSTDERTDLYALGATLYMLLTGTHPPESVQRVAADTLRPAHVVNPQVPAHIGEAIQHAMALTPTSRYPSVADFKAACANQSPPAPQFIQPAPETIGARAVAADAASPEPLPAPTSRPRKKGLPVWAIILIAVGGLGGLTLACLGGLYFYSNSVLAPTNTAAAQGTEKAITMAAATAQMAQQRTASARNLSQTETAYAGINRGTPSLGGDLGSLLPLFGPVSGALAHNDSNKLIETYEPNLNIKNFIAQVIFTNPYGSDEGKWDYGFLFRQTTDDNQYRLMTFSDGSWKLMNNINTPDGNLINEGVTSFMSTGASDSNFMRVVAYEERGWFFINDQLVGQVDLAARQAAGKVNLGTGFYTGNEKTGYETGYDDFSVWEIDAEGVSGELPHDDDSAIEEFEADVDLDNFIATGVFVNPYDFSFHTFDVGFLFRYTSGEQQYRMIISGNGKWGLMQNDGSADGTWIANDTAGNFNSGAGQRNRITLVALYDIGWLYINDNLTAELDLSGRRQSGDISIATGIYTNDEVVGYATAFEDFTVIPLP